MNSKRGRFQLVVISILVSLSISCQVVLAQVAPGDQPPTDNADVVIAQIKGGEGDIALELNRAIQDRLLSKDIQFINIDSSLRFFPYYKAEVLINEYDATIVIWGGSDSSGDNILLYFAFAEYDEVSSDIHYEYFTVSQDDSELISAYVIGQFHYYRGEKEASLEYFDNVISILEQRPLEKDSGFSLVDFYNLRASIQRETGNLVQAVQDYSAIIDRVPNDGFAFFDRGVVYYELGEYDLAYADFSRAIQLNPADADAYVSLGSIHLTLGEYDLAFANYQQAIELNSQLKTAYYGRGLVYSRLREYQLALADYDRAIELFPDYVEAHYARGYVNNIIGDYETAIEDHSRVLQIDSEYADAYYGRASAYFKLGNYPQALSDYEQVIALEPNSSTGYSGRGTIYQRIGTYALALDDFNKCIELEPYEGWHYANRAYVYFELEKYESAIEDLNIAIAQYPSNANYYWSRGNAYYELQEYELSTQDYLKYGELNGFLEPFMEWRVNLHPHNES